MRGESEQNYDAVYGAYTKLQRSVRMEGYKLIVYPGAKVVRLFNVERDPHEMNDLADNPEYVQLKKKMFKRLRGLQEEMEDTLDVAAVFPELG